MPAEVVAATLDQSPGGLATEDWGNRLGQPRHITIHDLGLQGQCRGGNDARPASVESVHHSGNEIGQRLACSRAGLNQEVLALGDSIGHRVHHLDLSGSLNTTDTLHCRVQECVKVMGFRRHCLRLCP